MIIFKKYFFDAAHFMPNYPKDHKYGRVHGHTFEVTVRVNGNIDNENNWVINYDELDQFVTPLLKAMKTDQRNSLLTLLLLASSHVVYTCPGSGVHQVFPTHPGV